MSERKAETFNPPPKSTTDSGKIRKVGFELEFAGVDLKTIADVVVDLYGGQIDEENRFNLVVRDTRYGEFTIEVDSAIIKDRRYKEFLRSFGVEPDVSEEESIEKMLMELASAFVPFELVYPPVPVDELGNLSPLEKALKERSALGTRASLRFGLGMQFNPEAPSLDTDSVLAHLRSFFLLLDWLKEEIDVDLTRRIAPYIDDFPEKYVRHVLDPTYQPDFSTLVQDFIEHNPTRNRPLDMLPLFVHVTGDSVLQKVEHAHLVKPRPTYHYRLPDCRIDEPDWWLSTEWNRWVRVEELAQQPDKITELSDYYLRHRGLRGWATRIAEWMGI